MQLDMKITVLGSCVSRISLLDGDQKGHGIAGNELKLEYFLDKQNIALAMMPPPFDKETVETITADELWDKSRLHSLKQTLLKETVPLLMNGESKYLVMDFFDFHNAFLSYKNTAFATQAHEFLQTHVYREHRTGIKSWCFFDMPTWIYYPWIDQFFETILQKFDSDHIILNRFRANTYYLSKEGTILPIPDSYKMPYQCHDKYNGPGRALEDYVIQKYDPYVIDLSQFFMGDANVWDNLQGAHFEREFYRETYDQIMRIVKDETHDKYFSQPRFFSEERRGIDEDRKRAFDIEAGFKTMEMLVEKEDILWLNVLDKLYMYAPNDSRVQEYVRSVMEEF
ncbi:MAG: hypothetical protein J1E61_05195 [Lachnospiraceae bacterium]|nr:hypothetical protein [Lachnospiraceae bacterium]